MKKRILFLLVPLSVFASSFNPQMQDYVDGLKVEAKKSNPNFVDFSAKRGEKIFTTSHIGKRGESISCTSCHTVNLKNSGKNVHTNKVLDPLSPTQNPKRLSKVKNVKKWLRRNFNDVYNKEGTALQKGDVLYYINSN
ncbi:DUF1924 domain-containing protein [Sulfurospirillum sp. 1307]